MPKDRDSKRKKRQRKAAEKTSVARTGHDKNNIGQQKQTQEQECSSLSLQSCQQEGLSRFRDVGGRPNQEKVASIRKGSRMKEVSRRKGF